MAVKIKASFEKKSARLNNNFRTYKDAEYNTPYLAAILSKSIIGGELFNFTLGKQTFNELSKDTTSSRASKRLDLFLSTLVIFLYTWKFCWSLPIYLKTETKPIIDVLQLTTMT